MRTKLIRAALVAGALATAGAVALMHVSSNDPRTILNAVAAHPDRFAASTLLSLIGAALILPGQLALLPRIPGRLGLWAIGLLTVNLVGNIADAGFGAGLFAAARDGVSGADVSWLHGVQQSAIDQVVEVMVLVGTLGFPLLAAALWRARNVPAAAAMAAAVVGFFMPGPGEAVGGALLVLGIALAVGPRSGQRRHEPVMA